MPIIITDPKLVEDLLGKNVAKLFKDTIKVIPSDGSKVFGCNVGDTIEFEFKNNNNTLRQFKVE